MFISKSYLLMVLNEDTGTSYSKGFESLGFAGSLLMDLFLQGKIALTQNFVEVVNSSSTGEDFLDPILEMINTSDEKRSLMSWIDKISQKFSYYYLYFDLLEQKGILKSEIEEIVNVVSSSIR